MISVDSVSQVICGHRLYGMERAFNVTSHVKCPLTWCRGGGGTVTNKSQVKCGLYRDGGWGTGLLMS